VDATLKFPHYCHKIAACGHTNYAFKAVEGTSGQGCATVMFPYIRRERFYKRPSGASAYSSWTLTTCSCMGSWSGENCFSGLYRRR
jgi:hypothetical protein